MKMIGWWPSLRATVADNPTTNQRQGDQAAETPLRHRVLIRKETIVGIQPDVRSRLHRLRDHVRAEPSGQRRWDGVLEEEPDVRASSRAGALEGGWKVQPATRVKKCGRIFLPSGLVEINGKEETRFVPQQGIDAGDKGLPSGVVAREVPPNHVVGHRKESTVGTFGALDAWLLADATHPLVGAGWRVA
jgi:hypothetical protein